jgi:hypothetical protein
VGASLLAAFVLASLWRRLPAAVAMPVLAGIGAAAAAGGLLVQDHASSAEWAIATVALAALTPLHARLLFGRAGADRSVPGVVAVDTGAAYKGRNP